MENQDLNYDRDDESDELIVGCTLEVHMKVGHMKVLKRKRKMKSVGHMIDNFHNFALCMMLKLVGS
jgi:hypothetical protein